MSELATTIAERLKEGFSPYEISQELEIPVDWVYQAWEADYD